MIIRTRVRAMLRGLLVIPLLVVVACGERQSAPDADASGPAADSHTAAGGPDCARLMQPMIDALWDGKTAGLESRVDARLVVVEQRYELTESDPTYVLGPAQSRAITDKAQLATLVGELAARAGERDGDLIPNPRDAAGTEWEATLAGFVPIADADRCAITLEIGDAEHVLVAALDKASASIKGIYAN